jgi:hypothetical protein
MSYWYALDVEFNKDYNKETIRTFLIQGISCGCIYLEKDNSYAQLQPKHVTQWILDLEHNPSLQEDGQGYVKVKFEDTYFSLYIDKNNSNNFCCFLATAEYRWEKNFSNSGSGYYYFDFARCIRLFLKMSHNFPIKQLKTITG